LAVVGMAVAGMVLTSSFCLSAGYPAGVEWVYRQFLGGEVLVYGGRWVVYPDEAVGAGQGWWGMSWLGVGELSHLGWFHPELFRDGFLRPLEAGEGHLDWGVLEEVVEEEALAGYYPCLLLPALMVVKEEGEVERWYWSPLRGRVVEVDEERYRFRELLVDGRVLGEGDRGQWVCLVDARREDVGVPSLGVGEEIELRLPRVGYDASGRPYFDYGHLESLTLQVVGTYQLPTRYIYYLDELEDLAAAQLYWATPEVLVTVETFMEIWRWLGGQGLPPIRQAALMVDDLSRLENLVGNLRRRLPDHTVISVPQQVRIAHARGLPEAPVGLPREVLEERQRRWTRARVQLALPMDVRLVILGLVYLVAGLLLAGNLLVMVSRRRREIAILKVAGAQSRDIAVMVISEALFLALLGGLVGFAVMSPMVLWTHLSNRADVVEVLVRALGQLTVVTVGFTLLFAWLPAWRTARLTAMEVFRNE